MRGLWLKLVLVKSNFQKANAKSQIFPLGFLNSNYFILDIFLIFVVMK